MVAQLSAGRTFRKRELVSYASASLGIDMVWATLTAFLPPMLERYGATPTMIGILMSVGPATGLIIQPLAGMMSDKAQTREGRRLPSMCVRARLAGTSRLRLCDWANL